MTWTLSDDERNTIWVDFKPWNIKRQPCIVKIYQQILHSSNHFHVDCWWLLLLTSCSEKLCRSGISRIHAIIIKPLCNDSTYTFFTWLIKISPSHIADEWKFTKFRELFLRCKFSKRKRKHKRTRKTELIKKPCRSLCTHTFPTLKEDEQ